jgi:CBS domain-containing protein
MKAKDVMTSPVVSIEPDASIWQAVRIMLQRHISGLPVIDQKGDLVGIVTEGDFLRRAETGTQRRRPRWLEYLIGPGRLADEYTPANQVWVHTNRGSETPAAEMQRSRSRAMTATMREPSRSRESSEPRTAARAARGCDRRR